MVNGWMVRAGEYGYLFSDFEKVNCVAIGWNEVGDMTDISDREEMKERVKRAYSDSTEAQLSTSVGQACRFRFDIKAGDIVVTYNPSERLYLVGEAKGSYIYKPGLVPDYDQIIPVKWLEKIPRDDFSVEARNSLGSALSCFSLGEHVLDEINSLLKGEKPTEAKAEITDEETELDFLRKDIIERANEFIKDKILKLSWEEMQDLVAGILRAMGYKTKISVPGPDRGKDIIASPDGLGIQQPRIKAQVKHRPATRIEVGDIRGFIGALRQHEIGLFVSTGGFTRESHYEAERSQTPVTLINLDDLVNVYIQYYDKLDAETRTLVPLIDIYWPA